MGIKNIPGEGEKNIEFKKGLNKPTRPGKKSESALQNKDVSVALPSSNDSLEISDAKAAIEKENILASKNSVENFAQAKILLQKILKEIDEKSLLEIHGNAQKIKTFFIM